MARKRFIRDDDITDNYELFTLNLEEYDYVVENREIDTSDIIEIENYLCQYIDDWEDISFRTVMLMVSDRLHLLRYIDTNLLEDFYDYLTTTFFLDHFLLGSEGEIQDVLINFFDLAYKTYLSILRRGEKKVLTKNFVESILTKLIETYWDLPEEQVPTLRNNLEEALDFLVV